MARTEDLPISDDQNHKLYPRSVAVKIKEILSNAFAEEVAEQLDLPNRVAATDDLKFKTTNNVIIKCLTVIAETESELRLKVLCLLKN